ncbi:hypothetical protein [Raineya sp.]
MAKNTYKKPDYETFRWICDRKMGNKTQIAKALECSLSGLNKWLANDAKMREIYEEVIEARLDFCESQMFTLIQGIPKLDKDKKIIGWEEKPSEKLIQFYLETRGKERGYVRQQDVKHSGEMGIVFNLVVPETEESQND